MLGPRVMRHDRELNTDQVDLVYWAAADRPPQRAVGPVVASPVPREVTGWGR